MKEAVHNLTADAKIACFISQGTGVKASLLHYIWTTETNLKSFVEPALLKIVLSQVYNWSGVPKHINFNKNVKCLAMTGDKLYCGCSGYSIQVNIPCIVSSHLVNLDQYSKFDSEPTSLCTCNILQWKKCQEVDLCKFTSTTFYSGTRKLLGKQTIYSLHIHDGLLFAGGSAVDGTAGKVSNSC